MTTLPSPLAKLAADYERLLFAGDLRDRLSHHLAHVAAENWLALELAMLVNANAEAYELDGWRAAVERARVDVTLIPPNEEANAPLSEDEAVFIELKLAGTDWWNTVWRDVRADLAGKQLKKSVKPRADLAVCFLMNAASHSLSQRQKSTELKYQRYVDSVPRQPGEFEPVTGEPKLLMLHSSAEHRLSWPRPIYAKWPSGYDASLRIVWVTESGRVSKLRDVAG